MAAQREHILNTDMTKAAQSELPEIQNYTEIITKKRAPYIPTKRAQRVSLTGRNSELFLTIPLFYCGSRLTILFIAASSLMREKTLEACKVGYDRHPSKSEHLRKKKDNTKFKASGNVCVPDDSGNLFGETMNPFQF